MQSGIIFLGLLCVEIFVYPSNNHKNDAFRLRLEFQQKRFDGRMPEDMSKYISKKIGLLKQIRRNRREFLNNLHEILKDTNNSCDNSSDSSFEQKKSCLTKIWDYCFSKKIKKD